MGVFHGLGAVGNHRTQKRLGNGIGQLIVQGIEIAVHGVHHNIRYAAGHLVHRQRKGQFRIHNGEFGEIESNIVQTPLAAGGLIGQH